MAALGEGLGRYFLWRPGPAGIGAKVTDRDLGASRLVRSQGLMQGWGSVRESGGSPVSSSHRSPRVRVSGVAGIVAKRLVVSVASHA